MNSTIKTAVRTALRLALVQIVAVAILLMLSGCVYVCIGACRATS